MEHNKKCNCRVCQYAKNKYSKDEALNVLQKENDMHIQKYGFVIHYVLPTEESPWANYHTHGLTNSRHHIEFQLVLPIQPEIAHRIIWNLVKLIDENKTFKNNELIYDIIQTYPIKFKKVINGDTEALRILLPDPNGLFYGDSGCDPIYAEQETIILEERKRQLQ